jgi:hypothetical protein
MLFSKLPAYPLVADAPSFRKSNKPYLHACGTIFFSFA